ncbi:MAG: PH domain-containing protein [Flaviflexus sp.]|nr:PH domain-containing protein [Flaviflexus sp.]
MEDAIYVLKSGGRDIKGYALAAAAILLTIIIVVDGGVTDLPTGAGFIAACGVGAWVFFLSPKVIADAHGITSIGPFRTTVTPWAEVEDVFIRWGMKIERVDGTVIEVPAFPTTGSITRMRYEGDDIDDFASGTHAYSTTSRKAAAFLQDRALHAEQHSAGRPASAQAHSRWHADKIAAWALALAALAANIYWLSTR